MKISIPELLVLGAAFIAVVWFAIDFAGSITDKKGGK